MNGIVSSEKKHGPKTGGLIASVDGYNLAGERSSAEDGWPDSIGRRRDCCR
jgi:hypothetical protein